MRKCLYLVLLFCCWSVSNMAHAVLRDPTQPGSFQSSEGDNQLTGILISNQRRIAVIDGQMLQVGDTVNGSKVISIDSNSVVLESTEGRTTLYLVDQSIRATSVKK